MTESAPTDDDTAFTVRISPPPHVGETWTRGPQDTWSLDEVVAELGIDEGRDE